MVVDRDKFVANAKADTRNDPGYCLQQTRLWADIDSKYNDASTAWRNANHRHVGDRHPPAGVAVYWTGGSKGYGHIAASLGNGKIRTTDGDGNGVVATRDLAWVENHWGLPYAGWADNINEVTIPAAEEEDDMAYNDWPENSQKALARDVVDALLARDLYDDDPEKKVTVGKALRQSEAAAQEMLEVAMGAWLKTFNANVEGEKEPPVGNPIKETNPDICVFTEAYHCREHLKEVAENRGYVLRMFGKDEYGEEGPDIAVLVRDSIKIVKYEAMKMKEPWWWNGNKREPRVYPKFLLDDPDLAGDLNWKYIAVHLPPGGPDGGKNGENKQAWRESQDRLVKYGNEHQDGPYLIAGDINATFEETKNQIASRLEGATQVGQFGKVDHLIARRTQEDSMKMNRMDSPIGHGWGTGKVAAQDRDSG